MPTRSRDLQQGNTGADEQVQAQRERLRQAFLGGASLEDVGDLMRAIDALLPKTPSKRTRPRGRS